MKKVVSSLKFVCLSVVGLGLSCFSGACASDINESEATSPQSPLTYCVVSLFGDGDSFNVASEELAERHNAFQLHANPNDLNGLLERLLNVQPKYVAFVVRPDDLDINLVNRILKLSTELDDDPFVDFACGVITGRDAEAALRLVQASAKRRHQQPAISQFSVGSSQIPRSMKLQSAWPLRRGVVPMTSCLSRGDTEATRDKDFIRKSLPMLDKSPILLFVSHGYPDGMVGGLKVSDIQGRDFAGSVALNVACYTGVTGTWYEDDWKSGTVKCRTVAPKDSFCLQMIDSGVAAYIAYTCPRPSGMNMMGDAMQIACGGESIGEYFRQVSNSIVLAHLLDGRNSVATKNFSAGDALNPKRTGKEMVLAMSTGGILFGDPAYRPFPAQQGANPVETKVVADGETLSIKLNLSPLFHFYCGEQLNYWDDNGQAIRLEANVPTTLSNIENVRLSECSLGEQPHRIVAAIEQHEGLQRLHLKAVLPAPATAEFQKLFQSGLSGTFEVEFGKSSSNRPKLFRSEKLY